MEEERPLTTAAERSPLAETTDATSERVDRRSSIEAALIVTVLIGVWLIVSAFALAYDKPAVPVIWGIVVILLAVLRLVGAMASRTLGAVTALTGALIIVSAFLIDDPPGPTANMALLGLAVIIVSVIGSAGPARPRN